jgi:hypothetical protein
MRLGPGARRYLSIGVSTALVVYRGAERRSPLSADPLEIFQEIKNFEMRPVIMCSKLFVEGS